MITYIIAGIIGILIWQVIICIFDYFFDEDIALTFAICIPYFIFKSICYIVCYPILFWCRRHLYRYCLCYKVYFQGSILTDEGNVIFFATKKMVENLSFDNTKDDYVKFIGNCANIKRIPYGYEIYKGQDTYQGWDMNLFRKEIKVKEKENMQ